MRSRACLVAIRRARSRGRTRGSYLGKGLERLEALEVLDVLEVRGEKALEHLEHIEHLEYLEHLLEIHPQLHHADAHLGRLPAASADRFAVLHEDLERNPRPTPCDRSKGGVPEPD